MSDAPRPSGASFPSIDWQRAEDYRTLARADRSAFAWEWLRRSSAYRSAWRQHLDDSSSDLLASRTFGLERFEDPELAIPEARPFWSASHDPGVIRAKVADSSERSDMIDLLKLSAFVSLAIDDEDIEHVLFSDGIHFLRIDVVEGTLIGCPSALRYKLRGIASLRAPLPILSRLITLVERGRIPNDGDAQKVRRERWILELRVADAIAKGATHHEIARALFGSVVETHHWRTNSSAYRLRVQRLVKGARSNLLRPLDGRWFKTVTSTKKQPF